MTDETRALIVALIIQLPPGTLFILRELLGDQWDVVNAGNPTGLGTRFSEAVARGEFPNVVFHEVPRSGRQNVWRKL
jgi:hypothetical protein